MRHPRVKPEHLPFRLPDGSIRIGGTVYGISAEIADPTGTVWSVLALLDGTRTATEIVSRLPGVALKDVNAIVSQLAAAGYVEDADAPAPVELTARDLQRYSRSAEFYRGVDLVARDTHWHAQRAFRGSRVVIVGLGGTGGTTATALAASGVGRLHLVDPDVVEISNLNRQSLYVENDIGRTKVEAAIERLGMLNSDIEITGKRRRIRGQGDVAGLLDGCDVLVIAADEPPTIRRWANRACRVSGTPWVDGGYSGPIVTVGTYVPGPENACWECLRIAERARWLRDDAALDPEAVEQAPPPRGTGVTAAAAGLSGHLVAHAVLALLSGAPALPTNCVYGFNLVVPEQRVFKQFPQSPDCPACGAHAVARAR
ncbi:MAG: ThiF family adenylyltransferase [Actinocatenispora sp.]